MKNSQLRDQVLKKSSQYQSSFLQALKQCGENRNIPNISWSTALFMLQTLEGREIKNILEIGPANGFSTLILRLAAPEAHIFSIECSRHAFEELHENINKFYTSPTSSPAFLGPKTTSSIFQKSFHEHTIYYADACELMPHFVSGSAECHCLHPKSALYSIPSIQFDFIFIDGAFRMTKNFFDLALPLLSSWWCIIIDDAIKYAWKMDWFYEYLWEQNIPYEIIHTDEDDGVMLIKNCNKLCSF